MLKKTTGYHFLRADMTSGSGKEPPWTIGEKRTINGGAIKPCARGYHASPSIFDALQYTPGPVLCLVELSGDVTPHGEPHDKWAARSRKLIAAVNVERELRLLACDFAERILPIFERKYQKDKRPRIAIKTARRFADGKATREELTAAWAAAGAAAWAAAGAAERNWQRERTEAVLLPLLEKAK